MERDAEETVWSAEGPLPRFGELARHLRQMRGVSQSALAQAARIASSTLRGWEAGRNEPSIPEFLRWSRALGLSQSLVGAAQATLVAPRVWAQTPGVGLGAYLRERRLAQARPLGLLAADLGLPASTLGHYETGRIEIPKSVLGDVAERLGIVGDERAALDGDARRFFEWCDSLVVDHAAVDAALNRAAWASRPEEVADRGAAFVRLRTGLLRARLRGPAWDEWDRETTNLHAYWLVSSGRGAEGRVALASARLPRSDPGRGHEAFLLIARRQLDLAPPERLLTLADAIPGTTHAAWLRAEAALDLAGRRRGAEARAIVAEARREAEGLDDWGEAWMRARDGVRVALRTRDWSAAEAEIEALATLEPGDLPEDSWFVEQRAVLRDSLRGRMTPHRAS